MITTATTHRPLLPNIATTDLAVLKSRHHVSELVARGPYGLRDGYSSLDAAVSHIGSLTTGDARGGAAIVQSGNRYYGVRVLEKISDARTSSGLRGAWLDTEDDSALRLMPFNQHAALRAVVDGTKVLYAKGVK